LNGTDLDSFRLLAGRQGNYVVGQVEYTLLAIFQTPPISRSNIQSLNVTGPCISVSRAQATFPADSIESIVRWRVASSSAGLPRNRPQNSSTVKLISLPSRIGLGFQFVGRLLPPGTIRGLTSGGRMIGSGPDRNRSSLGVLLDAILVPLMICIQAPALEGLGRDRTKQKTV
jgi:hypothetical protein